MEVIFKKLLPKFLPILFFLSAVLVSDPVLAKSGCYNNAIVDIKTSFIKKLSRKLDHGDIIFAACKPSPVHIDQTYAVFITQRTKQICANECNYNLIFLLADNAGNKIRYLYIKENALLSSTRIIQNVTIDTDIYQLNPFLRAVGIRIEKRKPVHSIQTYSNELHLFIEDGKTFRPLFYNDDEKHLKTLSALSMKEVEKSKQKNNNIDNTCNLYRNESIRTIEFGDYHNGFRDLIIKSNIINILGLKEKDGCAEQKIASTSGQTVIPYDGYYYRLPDWLRN